MATNTVGIDKEVEVNRKENLRDHRLYWIGRRTQDVILSSLALVVLFVFVFSSMVVSTVEDLPYLDSAFEVASAMGTVGLTTGITPSSSRASKVLPPRPVPVSGVLHSLRHARTSDWT